jgi:hypothetical protein
MRRLDPAIIAAMFRVPVSGQEAAFDPRDLAGIRVLAFNLRFSREPQERTTHVGRYGLFTGVTDLMCAPMNIIELRREGAC